RGRSVSSSGPRQQREGGRVWKPRRVLSEHRGMADVLGDPGARRAPYGVHEASWPPPGESGADAPSPIGSDQLIRPRAGHGAFLHRAPGELLGEGVILRVERLLPGDFLAAVGRVAAHDGRERALGDLLQLVDRLMRRDALEQVDVLLHVWIDLALDADAGPVGAGEAEVAVPRPLRADE